MPHNQLEQGSDQPTKEVELDQWVKPFENYESIPRVGQNLSEAFDQQVKFKSPQIGNWAVGVEWNQRDIADMSQRANQFQDEVLVILPNGARVVRKYELANVQKEIESCLTHLNVIATDLFEQMEELGFRDSDFEASLKLPTGEELKANLAGIAKQWSLLGKQFPSIYIPDTAHILEQIEIKISKISQP